MMNEYSDAHFSSGEHDTALHGLLGMADGQLTDLMASEFALARQQAARSEARMLAYLDDLAAVLRMPCGSGLRVVRHWLDAACASERISGRPDNHPVFVEMMAHVGEMLGEDALGASLSGGGGAGPMSTEDFLRQEVFRTR